MSRLPTLKGNLTKGRHHPGSDSAPDGRIVTKKREYARPLRERARELLEDPEYIEALRDRLIAGEAGALESWLYRYGYGEPKPDKADEEQERQRFEDIREEVKAIIAGKEGKVLAMAVGRSTRKKLTKLPAPRKLMDGTGSD